jgi:hypothetical protein
MSVSASTNSVSLRWRSSPGWPGRATLMTMLSQCEQFRTDVIDLADLSLPDSLDGGGDASIFAKRVDGAGVHDLIVRVLG